MPSRVPQPNRLSVLLVDEHAVSRGAIRALLQTEGLDVVDAADRRQALAVGHAARPDVVVVDLGSEPRRAIATARALAALRSAPAVVLTSSSTPSTPLHGFAFLAKGDIRAGQLRSVRHPATHTIKETTMSMQSYLDNITAKTGRTPDELVAHARAEGLLEPGVKAGQLVAWLKAEYELGHGHAMAIVARAKKQTEPQASTAEKVTRHFSAKKSSWRPVYDQLVRDVSTFGSDTDVLAGGSYLSLRRSGRKFAIVQVTTDRMDIGIKLKDAAPEGRLEAAGSWNAMVTHRVRVHGADEVDGELLGWLHRAYAAA